MSEFTDIFWDWDRTTVTIYTPTRTIVHGEQTVSWASATADVFLDQITEAQRYGVSNISDEATMMLYAEASTSIAATDVVKFGSRYFEVLPINNPLQQGELLQVQLREVENKPDGI